MDLEFTEGADYLMSLVIQEGGKALPLGGYVFEAQVRADFSPNSPLILAFEVTIPDPESGEVWFSADKAALSGLAPSAKPQQGRVPLGVYDIFMTTPAGSRNLLYQARVRYRKAVTRSLI